VSSEEYRAGHRHARDAVGSRASYRDQPHERRIELPRAKRRARSRSSSRSRAWPGTIARRPTASDPAAGQLAAPLRTRLALRRLAERASVRHLCLDSAARSWALFASRAGAAGLHVLSTSQKSSARELLSARDGRLPSWFRRRTSARRRYQLSVLAADERAETRRRRSCLAARWATRTILHRALRLPELVGEAEMFTISSALPSPSSVLVSALAHRCPSTR